MKSPDIRALIACITSGGANKGLADERDREAERAGAMNELLQVAQRLLDELTAALPHERWPDRSVSDLKNHVLFQFSQNAAQFRGKSTAEIRCWLKKSLKFARSNFHRHADRRRPEVGGILSLDVDGLLDDSSIPRGISIEPIAGDLSVSRQVQLDVELRRLAPFDRQLLELRYHEQLTIERIAERLGRHERTVRRDLDRILSLLREKLEPPR